MRESEVIEAFSLTTEDLRREVARVEAAIAGGLRGEPSPFLLLPSFLGLPSGREEGEFLALDFGGSNLRLARITLRRGFIGQSDAREWPLKELAAASGYEADALFFNIAKKIDAFAGRQGAFLGHTFSYPAVQSGINDARMKSWTKETHFSGGENIDINGRLRRKLILLGRDDVVPAAVLNDTTAVLLAAAYQSGGKNVAGSICGTGHNSCYYEPDRKMSLNLEAGNFAPACRNPFDLELDSRSAEPGAQLLEKMTAGDYLAKLASLAARALDISARPETAVDLAAILDAEQDNLNDVARAIVKRAAALVAAEYFGLSLSLAGKGIA